MAVFIPIISEFDAKGIDKAKKEFASLETAGAKAQYAIKKAAVPAAAGLVAVGAALFDATKGAIEDAAAQEVLATNLRNSAHATDAQIKATEDIITQMSMATGVADDELRPAYSKLVLATKDVERSSKLLAIAQDIAAATGKPLESVTQALAKAEMGQYAALKKLGIPMSEGIQASIDLQKEQKKLAKIESEVALVNYQIAEGMLTGSEASKKLTTANEKLASQSAIVNDLMASTGDYADDVAKQFGGAAANAAGTAEGQFKRLGVALAETKESIGAALLPAIEAVLPFLQSMGKWASEHPEILLAIGAAIATIAAAIVAVNIAMALNPFSLIAIAVVGLGALLVTAYKKFAPFKTVVDGVFGAIEFWIDNVTIPAIKTMLTVFKTVFNGIASIWNNTVGKISFELPKWIPGIGGKGFEMPNIPMLAEGGIVTGPTLAMIGEGNGPEAVIPLNRMSEFGMGGGGNITINVNGADPQAVVDALRRYQRQNGFVPITVGV